VPKFGRTVLVPAPRAHGSDVINNRLSRPESAADNELESHLSKVDRLFVLDEGLAGEPGFPIDLQNLIDIDNVLIDHTNKELSGSGHADEPATDLLAIE